MGVQPQQEPSGAGHGVRMTTDTRPVTTVDSSVTVERPAATVAAFVLDWGNDHLWRSRVKSFTCAPPGRAVVGQKLVEDLRFIGLTFITPTTIDFAGELSASYAGGSSTIGVEGLRVVTPLDEARCAVRTTTRLRVGGLLRPFAPLLVAAYRRADATDLRALPAVLEAQLRIADGVPL